MFWFTPSRISALAPSPTNQTRQRLLACALLLTLTACDGQAPSKVQAPDSALTTNDALLETDAPSTPLFAQLSGDALVAPPQPDLRISASPGKLTLQWDTIADQEISRVYRFDSQTRQETLVDQFSGTETQALELESQSHTRAWHREFFRVELCTAINCISSQRTGITGLLQPTLQTLTPAVFVENERFADDAVMNHDASLLIVTLPVEGALQLYLRPEAHWVTAQSVQLQALVSSATRNIDLALSANGDTLAAAITDNAQDNKADIRMLERLGESWVETTRTTIDSSLLASQPDYPATLEPSVLDRSLLLSDDGDRLVAVVAGHVFVSQRTIQGWTEPTPLSNDDHSNASTPFTERFSQSASLRALAASGSLDTVFTLNELDEQVWVSVWQQTPVTGSNVGWQKTAAYRIDDLDANRDLRIQSHANGTQIAIAGWENNATLAPTPVMWRYDISAANNPPTDEGALSDAYLIATDSLRLAPVQTSVSRIRFDADSSLTQIVLGWQGPVDSTMASDAALYTYRFDSTERRWISQLELPDALPTLAKQSFASLVRLSRDGSTLLYVSAAGQSLLPGNRVGEINILR